MNIKKAEYLKNQFLSHIKLFFTAQVSQTIDSSLIKFCPLSEINSNNPALYIPIDIPVSINPESVYQVPFNGTQVTLWNPIVNPDRQVWEGLPNENTPVWYLHKSGAIIPAWNLFGNIFNLLAFTEELSSDKRDIHDRFIGSYSPRTGKNLLEVPAFNEAAALIVDAVRGLSGTGPVYNLEGLLKPPVVVLSHDCDILAGNDFWTQAVRAYRIFEPLFKGRLPQVKNLWWIIKNYLSPRKYYFDEALGMITLERQFGFHSIFYLLNGTYGRFGARSNNKTIADLIKQIPEEWEIGIHFNYDTYLNCDALTAQKKQLSLMTNRPLTAGRAHYLHMNTTESFEQWQELGVIVDESAGYPDFIGYRCGIGGIFQLYDTSANTGMNIFEIPLVIMEDILLSQYPDSSVNHFEQLLQHMKQIGGALSLVIHPGMLRNPEHPQCRDFYYNFLRVCCRRGAVSKTPNQLVKEFRQGLSPDNQ
ncbi:MAG: hypothetical protein KAR42_06055 [candidate division Zixibacteria bacterium]|nr:hypothetical protein [candidate division Zixibacteria bacterium]